MFGFGKKTDEEIQEPEQIAISSVTDLEREISSYDLTTAPRSTTMTPSDIYMLAQAGKEVIQVVQGNIVYSMGIRGVFQSISRAIRRGEVVPFTRLNQDARRIALNRMLQEAARLGADEVIGIVFAQELLADALEVTVLGTAVRNVNTKEKGTVEIAVSTT